MRLTHRLSIALLAVGALTVPAMAAPKFLTKNPFHRTAKAEKTPKPATKVDKRKNTNGFPEADKRDSKYQPQFDTSATDMNWKTTSNKEAFNKQAEKEKTLAAEN